MNPLDKEELKAFLKIIEKDMPIHTDKTAKIKRSYSQGMPKNIKEYSDKVDNNFLNDNLHIIEEMEFRKKGITDDFRNYQNEYYDKSGILNHDLYFKHDDKIYAKVRGGSFFNQNALSFSNASLNRTVPVSGADITIGDSSANSTAYHANIYLNQLSTTAVIGSNYDRLAQNAFNSTGNMRLAAYDSSSSIPTNLYAETSSVALDSAFTWRTVTNFSLITAEPWFGLQIDVSGGGIYRKLQNTPRKSKSFTYGAFETPLTGTGNNLGAADNCKIGHS